MDKMAAENVVNGSLFKMDFVQSSIVKFTIEDSLNVKFVNQDTILKIINVF